MNNEAMQAETMQGQNTKRYEPPHLITINLRPEEAVLGHCKISGSGGPVNPGNCAALNCMTIGS
jgi:hypothetical protein